MFKEVEILKIGSVIPAIISKLEIIEGKKERKDTIMVVSNGGPIFDYYINMLIENCSDYNFMSAEQSIVGTPETFRSSLLGHKQALTLNGICDGDPVVGKVYSIDNGSWHSSMVNRIINNIIITRNSVYAIHSVSYLRDIKLKELGI